MERLIDVLARIHVEIHAVRLELAGIKDELDKMWFTGRF